jgi:hypothetical protein
MYETGEAWVSGMHGPIGPVAGPGPADDDVADHLRALMAKGFRFAHPRRANGDIAAVVGVRAHHHLVDIVQLLGEREADAVRISGDEPDILSPRHVFWRATGPAHTVLHQVLHLPDVDVGPAGADSRPAGCWVPAGPARSVWLPTAP